MLRQAQQIGVPLVVKEKRYRSSVETAVYLLFETHPLEHPELCEPLRKLIYKNPTSGMEQPEPRPLDEWDLDEVEAQLKFLSVGIGVVADAAETALERLHAFRY